MSRILILKWFLGQLNCLLQWCYFSCTRQKLLKLHFRFLETIHLHLFDIILILYWFPRRSLLAVPVQRSQNVFRHLDIICQTFGKLISSLDSDVVILFLYSLAYCFLIHSKKHLWSNLTLDCFLGMVVRFDSLTNSNLGEMR